MKKIISLLSVFAMIATMFTTVSFAADNEVVFTEVNKTTNSVDIEVSIKTTYSDLDSAAIYFDMSDAISKNATISVTKGVAGMTWTAAQNMVAIAFKPTDGSVYTSGAVLGTIHLTGISENFTIALKPSSGRTITKITTKGTGTTNLCTGDSAVFPASAMTSTITMVEEAKTTMDKPVAGNDMYGMKTALTKITFNNVENPVVKLAKDGEDSGKSYDLPANVKGGATEIIGIIRYAADVTGEFVLSVFDGETEVVSTSYIAE